MNQLYRLQCWLAQRPETRSVESVFTDDTGGFYVELLSKGESFAHLGDFTTNRGHSRATGDSIEDALKVALDKVGAHEERT